MSIATTLIHLHCSAQATVDTPLGPVLLARTPNGLAGGWFEGQQHHPGALAAAAAPGDPLLARAAEQITAYFAGRQTAFDIPLDLQGTPFQRAVWLALLGIGFGATSSYGQIARLVGRPSAMRAVGSAIGRNPVSVVVPCHRVVGSDGNLTGYAGGVPRKRALLALEAGLRRPVEAERIDPQRVSMTGAGRHAVVPATPAPCRLRALGDNAQSSDEEASH